MRCDGNRRRGWSIMGCQPRTQAPPEAGKGRGQEVSGASGRNQPCRPTSHFCPIWNSRVIVRAVSLLCVSGNLLLQPPETNVSNIITSRAALWVQGWTAEPLLALRGSPRVGVSSPSGGTEPEPPWNGKVEACGSRLREAVVLPAE